MTSRMFAVLAVGLLATVASADPDKPIGSPAGKLAHMVALPDDLKWGDAPPVLPAGAQAAVLDGDPTKAAPFTIRLKVPDGYIVPPHWHSVEENVTVISGSFGLGLGDKVDKAKIRYLPPGSYIRLGREERHYAVAKGETV